MSKAGGHSTIKKDNERFYAIRDAHHQGISPKHDDAGFLIDLVETMMTVSKYQAITINRFIKDRNKEMGKDENGFD